MGCKERCGRTIIGECVRSAMLETHVEKRLEVVLWISVTSRRAARVLYSGCCMAERATVCAVCF